MDTERLRELLTRVQNGETGVENALDSLRTLPFEDLGFAKLDHHRALRNGFPEVIYCPSKTTEHILAIAEKLTERADKVLASRASAEVAAAVLERFPNAVYHELAKMLVIRGKEEPHAKTQRREEESGEQYRAEGTTASRPQAGGEIGTSMSGLSPHRVPADYRPPNTLGTVLIVAAGTADLPVAEEAFITASEMGSPTDRMYDVGVAGIHRLLSQSERLFAANVLVVVAGMEGALPSVIGGLVSRPVIAVPTSVGYGANFGGLSALLTMLNSCATGIGVVNIDNGFGAGYLAHLINQVPYLSSGQE